MTDGWWHHWLAGCEFEWTPGVGDRQCPCCGAKSRGATTGRNGASLTAQTQGKNSPVTERPNDHREDSSRNGLPTQFCSWEFHRRWDSEAPGCSSKHEQSDQKLHFQFQSNSIWSCFRFWELRPSLSPASSAVELWLESRPVFKDFPITVQFLSRQKAFIVAVVQSSQKLLPSIFTRNI